MTTIREYNNMRRYQAEEKNEIIQDRHNFYNNILSDHLIENINNDSSIADILFDTINEDKEIKQKNALEAIHKLKEENSIITTDKPTFPPFLSSSMLGFFVGSFTLLIETDPKITIISCSLIFLISFFVLLQLRRCKLKQKKEWKENYPTLLKSAEKKLNSINKEIEEEEIRYTTLKNGYYNKDIAQIPNVMLFALSELIIIPIYKNKSYWNNYDLYAKVTANFNNKTSEIIFHIALPPKNCIRKKKVINIMQLEGKMKLNL